VKIYRKAIRVWITLVSLASFAVGWIVLAHSPKPNQFKASDVQAMPALPPIPSIEQLSSGSQFSGFSIPQRPMARLRTGGS